MPSRDSMARCALALALAVLVVGAGCSSAPRGGPPGPALQPLSQSERVTHVLSRLTFGARPGDAERVAAMGVNRWIDQQLRPAAITDTAVEQTLSHILPWAN